MRSLRAQTIAWLTAVIVFVAGGVSPKTHYFCHMMGRVVASCCCADHDGPSKVECGAEVRAPDCCERIESRGVSTLPRAPEKATTFVSSAARASVMPEVVMALPPPDSSAVPMREARAPPGVGPPLFLAHCAILI